MARQQESPLSPLTRTEEQRARFSFLDQHSLRGATEPSQTVVWSVALFPLAFVALMLIAKLLAPGKYAYLIREDGFVEYATCLVYLVAAGFAASLAVTFSRQGSRLYGALHWLLAAGLAFIAMEEISWGQRLVGFETPASLARFNYQNEANLHNVAGASLHTLFVAVCAYGAFARMLVPRRLKTRQSTLVDLVTAPHLTVLYFFIPFLLYSYYEAVRYYLADDRQFSAYFGGANFITGKDQEPIELLLSFGFLLFVLSVWHRYGRRETGATVPG